jgi:hypothetical protein
VMAWTAASYPRILLDLAGHAFAAARRTGGL